MVGSIDKNTSSNYARLELGLASLHQRLQASSTRAIEDQNTSLEHAEKNIKHLSPENVMRRGYSITLRNGRAVTSISGLDPNDKITTKIADGEIESTINTVRKNSNE